MPPHILTKEEIDELTRLDRTGICYECRIRPYKQDAIIHRVCEQCYEPGFIYVLMSQDGYVKIGKTTRLSRRLSQIKLQMPFKVKVVGVIWAACISSEERELHQQFSEKRTNGEWFLLDEEDLRQLRMLAFFSSFTAPESVKKERS